MGLLKDTGRSNLGVEAQRLHQMVLEQRRMNLAEQQVNQKLQLGELNKQLVGLQIRQARNNLKLKEQEMDRLNTPINLRMHPIYQGLSPEGQKKADSLFKSIDAIDENGITTIGDLTSIGAIVESIPEFFKPIIGEEVKSKEDTYFKAKASLDKMISDLREKGKNPNEDKKVQALTSEVNRLREEANRARLIYEKHAESIQQNSIGKTDLSQFMRSVRDKVAVGMSPQEAINSEIYRKPASPETVFRDKVDSARDFRAKSFEARAGGLGIDKDFEKETFLREVKLFGRKVAKADSPELYETYKDLIEPSKKGGKGTKGGKKEDEAVTVLTEHFPPSANKGKIKTDKLTGKQYISDGKTWKEYNPKEPKLKPTKPKPKKKSKKKISFPRITR